MKDFPPSMPNQSSQDITIQNEAGLTWLQLVNSNNRCNISSEVSPKQSAHGDNDAINNVSIHHINGRNLIRFNLSSPSDSLVTVFDMEGKIISIQQFRSHKNTEELPQQNHLGSYIVRILIKSEKLLSVETESYIKIVHLR